MSGNGGGGAASEGESGGGAGADKADEHVGPGSGFQAQYAAPSGQFAPGFSASFNQTLPGLPAVVVTPKLACRVCRSRKRACRGGDGGRAPCDRCVRLRLYPEDGVARHFVVSADSLQQTAGSPTPNMPIPATGQPSLQQQQSQQTLQLAGQRQQAVAASLGAPASSPVAALPSSFPAISSSSSSFGYSSLPPDQSTQNMQPMVNPYPVYQQPQQQPYQPQHYPAPPPALVPVPPGTAGYPPQQLGSQQPQQQQMFMPAGLGFPYYQQQQKQQQQQQEEAAAAQQAGAAATYWQAVYNQPRPQQSYFPSPQPAPGQFPYPGQGYGYPQQQMPGMYQEQYGGSPGQGFSALYPIGPPPPPQQQPGRFGQPPIPVLPVVQQPTTYPAPQPTSPRPAPATASRKRSRELHPLPTSSNQASTEFQPYATSIASARRASITSAHSSTSFLGPGSQVGSGSISGSAGDGATSGNSSGVIRSGELERDHGPGMSIAGLIDAANLSTASAAIVTVTEASQRSSSHISTSLSASSTRFVSPTTDDTSAEQLIKKKQRSNVLEQHNTHESGMEELRMLGLGGSLPFLRRKSIGDIMTGREQQDGTPVGGGDKEGEKQGEVSAAVVGEEHKDGDKDEAGDGDGEQGEEAR